MRTKKDIETQLEAAYENLKENELAGFLGKGVWSRRKGYIDALEWVLSCSEEETEINERDTREDETKKGK